jgi:hypothetical protein
MRHAFYDSPAYRATQSQLTKQNQIKGIYKHLVKQVTRTCARPGCTQPFSVQQGSSKKYCSNGCAARVNNVQRGARSAKTKQKISVALRGLPSTLSGNHRRGMILVPRVEIICDNPKCQKKFHIERWRKVKYCSLKCAMRVIGGRPTSPKASRGKAGIRKDISDSIYFYSRWEANMARLYNYLKIKWAYAPRSFDIGGHTYTPDFYLPESDTYVEVKNFWGEYSKVRDLQFRKTHRNIRLDVLLKDEYLKLEKKYAHLITAWEYKNSPFVLAI